MTTVVAFDHTDSVGNSYTCLAADRKVTSVDGAIINLAASKIIFDSQELGLPCAPVAIAAAGSWGSICVIKSLLLQNKGTWTLPQDEANAIIFARELRSALLDEDMNTSPDKEMGGFVAGTLPCELLVANNNGILIITTSMEVHQQHAYSAIGSGRAYALGALWGKVPHTDDPSILLDNLFDMISEHDADTGSTYTYTLVPFKYA